MFLAAIAGTSLACSADDEDADSAMSCSQDSECGGYRCNLVSSTCLTGCVAGDDGTCAPGSHCDSQGACVADVAVAGACLLDRDCRDGLHCENGTCCGFGRMCCRSDAHCTGDWQGASCEIASAECTTACTGEDRDGCTAGFHCDLGVCRPDSAAGGRCDEASDCGVGAHCENNLCCAVGSVCCDRDGLCEAGFAGYRCDTTTFSCRSSCADDAACSADRHCEGGACVPDVGQGAACDASADCAAGLHCGGGMCCAGATCCASDDECDAAGSNYRCNVATNSCHTSCDDGDDSACGPGRHCEYGICIDEAPSGGVCRDDSDCADGSDWCRNSICCLAGKDCCSADNECGTCQKCDKQAGVCIPQLATEDLRNECNPAPNSCTADLCSGSGSYCAVKPANTSCGVCRRCDAAGDCVGNSVDHTTCPQCEACNAGSCVDQSNTEDVKNECNVLACSSFLYGFDGGVCKTYASPLASNTGLCLAGACPVPTNACTGVGAANATVSCADPRCQRCPAGGLATSYDSAAEACATDYERVGCPTGFGCGPLGNCVVLRSCKEIKIGDPTAVDGIYTVDPDGSGSNPPFNVYCEMTTDGGGWTVMAYLKQPSHWDTPLFTNLGSLGDTVSGFASGQTLYDNNATFTEKIIIYLNLVERSGGSYVSQGKQWMIDSHSPFTFQNVNTSDGWFYRDSFGYSGSTGSVCSHGCSSYRGFGMFKYYYDASGNWDGIGWCGTQGGNNGCRDGNNICWMPRGFGCNVGDNRCAYLTGSGEGVIYGVR